MEAYQATTGDTMKAQKHTMTILAQIASWIPDRIVEKMGNYILEFPDDIVPHWSMTRMRLAASLRYAARRTGTVVVI